MYRNMFPFCPSEKKGKVEKLGMFFQPKTLVIETLNMTSFSTFLLISKRRTRDNKIPILMILNEALDHKNVLDSIPLLIYANISL